MNISITTGTLFRAMLVLLGFALLFYLRSLLLVVLTAVVIASSIEPITLRLKRFNIPRIIAVLSIYIILSVAFVGIFYFFVPFLLSDTANFLRAIPELLDQVSVPIAAPALLRSATTMRWATPASLSASIRKSPPASAI